MSTLAIKNIEHRTGGTISLDDSLSLASGKTLVGTTAASIYSPGQIVQVAYTDGHTYQGVEGTTIASPAVNKLIELVLTLKTTNPIIRVRYTLPVGMSNSYLDTDLALGFGIRNGGADNTVGNYANFGGIARSRQNITFSDGSFSHYTTDTMGGGTSGTQYWQFAMCHEYQAAVTMNSGTSCAVSLWGSTENGTYAFYRPYSHFTGDAGSNGGFVLEEIAQ